jgi:hypothetical protein
MAERKPGDLLSSELWELWTYVGSAVHDAIMHNDGGHQDTAGEHIGMLTDAERARAEEALTRVLGYVRRAERLPWRMTAEEAHHALTGEMEAD